MASEDNTRQPLRTYRGNCHCKAFVYEVQLPEIKAVKQCNCSICHKKGYLWVLVQETGHFKIVKGSEDTLSSYTFNTKNRIHKNGYVWMYPLNEQVVLHAEEPANIGRYAFSMHMFNKTFCKICGVNLTNEYNADQNEEQKARRPEHAEKWEAWARRHHPVNLRVLPEVDISKMSRRYGKGYAGIPPLYENP
ncbi:glutathione-dependent formaldehyde-activating enzyme [Metarhizium robertsii ARSEF 23]|uniref:Glutathione-dependent formaldehyde-activating enzyme n=1 Tax=Metarhizium robertsii (strain ARSEF 23 / ATCC MYA-3075) TaxID=655844 RepID=E9EX39_METRA|nr:glutathione-dependent formaldehyde-activating enzyme [Metarhizium robertsii ARSEF 23]EFY99659.1 glutathione-dependent formaldehyde-activating enzyme [Metarhizium robertsii ARSEF 23]